MRRKIWMTLYTLFFRGIPEFFRIGVVLRRIAVRHFLLSCGKNINIGYGCRVHKNTVLGNHSGIGRNCEIMNGVKIGNDVLIGPDVYMCTENHNFSDLNKLIREQGFRSRKEIVIEDNVWIGARVIILPGVTIGKGSVIGAGSVVSKSVPSNVVVVGNPARIVKERA